MRSSVHNGDGRQVKAIVADDGGWRRWWDIPPNVADVAAAGTKNQHKRVGKFLKERCRRQAWTFDSHEKVVDVNLVDAMKVVELVLNIIFAS